MVLYRAEQHRDMELIRNVAVERTVILIQVQATVYTADDVCVVRCCW